MMKKIIIVVCILSVIGLCVVGFQQLLDYGKKIYTVASYEQQKNKTTFSYVKFQSVPENTALLNSVLKVNEGFLANPPLSRKNEKKLGKAYTLRNFFPNFSSYYTAKRKMENTIFNDMQSLYEATKALSSTQLKNYFERNASEIEKTFLITDWDSFELFCQSLSAIGDSEIASCYVVPDSVLYNSYDNSSVFNIVIVTKENQKFLLGVTASLEYTVPKIQFNGSFGGVFE